MSIPNLAGVITKADVDTKGTGSYASSYVNWAKVAHLLHDKAPGWEFHLKPYSDGSLIWPAPDSTAFVVGYFTGPEDQATADFPFPAMDNRNNPIPLDKISARTLTDTHRRALCAAACFTFGLAFELWAKEEVENPHREEKAATPAPKTQAKPATPAQPAPAPAPTAKPAVEFAKDSDVAAIKAAIAKHPKKAEIIDAFKAFKGLAPGIQQVSTHIQFPADLDFLNAQLAA
jgi:hypothetical protein